MRDFFEKYFNPRVQKVLLNLVLLFVILLIEVGCLSLIYCLKPEQFYIEIKQSPGSSEKKNSGTGSKDSSVTLQANSPSDKEIDLPKGYQTLNPEVFTFTAMAVIIGWIGILIGFYAWAIYHYNINLGKTNEEWARVKQDRAANESLRSVYPDLAEDPESYAENPFKEETFGLPPGTVRGTIALSMLVGGFALLILSQNLLFNNYNDNVEKYLEYFKTAFMMMIAFYFGSQSLKYLRNNQVASVGKSGEEVVPTPPAKDSAGTGPRPPDKDKNGRLSSLNLNTDLKALEQVIPEAVQPKQKLTRQEIKACADASNIEPALIKAVMKLESGGAGFLADGRPVILFESHIFWRELKNNSIDPAGYLKTHPDLVSEKWTRAHYSKIRAMEYVRLNRAIEIHKDSALRSCSWGLFQIMGFNYKKAGFDSVDAFVEAQRESEKRQLEIFISFLQNRGLLDLLREKKWEDFARNYNGAGYRNNHYHEKLEQAYEEYYLKENPVVKASLKRTLENEKETLGELTILSAERPVFRCKTLELPWKDNRNNISCIPAGTYQVKKRNSPRHGDHFHLQNVPERSLILIHSGNFYHEIRGCILVGEAHVHIDNDGFTDVSSSKATMARLNSVLPEEFEIEIV